MSFKLSLKHVSFTIGCARVFAHKFLWVHTWVMNLARQNHIDIHTHRQTYVYEWIENNLCIWIFFELPDFATIYDYAFGWKV